MSPVEQFLQSNGIGYTLHEHPAVFTCEEAEKYCAHVPGMPGKNLFLRNKNGTRYFLVILPAHKRSDLKKFGEIVGDKKITFCSSERLREKLGLEPGSVSPFGLLNDVEKQVEVFIDSEMYNSDIVNFHPNRNTASLELSKEMFHKYWYLLEQKKRVIEL